LNSIEWSPTRRGTLASGADDSLVLLWDLLSASTSTPASLSQGSGQVNGANSGNANTQTAGSAGQGDVQIKTPVATWRCPYEVSNLSWAPQSVLTSGGGDWLGVCAGRGVWGVKM